MEEKIRRIFNWMQGKKDYPYTLDINPTDKCNLACLSCWRRNPKFKNLNPDEYELEEKTIKRYVKEGLMIHVEEFEITGGGEPLMRKKLVLELMKMIKSFGRFGNITTNGTLFTESDVRFLVKSGWDRITFSLDGPNEKINDYLRGRGTFERVMNGIGLFNKWKEKLRVRTPILKFNFVISNKNYTSVADMIKLANQKKVEIIHFDKLTIHSKIGESLKLKGKEIQILNKELKKADRLAKKYSIWTNAVELTKEKFVENSNEMTKILRKHSGNQFVNAFCYEPWWHIVVKVDGSVQPCCLYDEKIENVKNKSLKDIWFGQFFEGIRKSILERKFSKYCSICNAGQVLENWRIRNELIRCLNEGRCN